MSFCNCLAGNCEGLSRGFVFEATVARLLGCPTSRSALECTQLFVTKLHAPMDLLNH